MKITSTNIKKGDWVRVVTGHFHSNPNKPTLNMVYLVSGIEETEEGATTVYVHLVSVVEETEEGATTVYVHLPESGIDFPLSLSDVRKVTYSEEPAGVKVGGKCPPGPDDEEQYREREREEEVVFLLVGGKGVKAFSKTREGFLEQVALFFLKSKPVNSKAFGIQKINLTTGEVTKTTYEEFEEDK